MLSATQMRTKFASIVLELHPLAQATVTAPLLATLEQAAGQLPANKSAAVGLIPRAGTFVLWPTNDR